MDTTLVIMAAGIGSRFGGGIKQLEPVGPNGEIIMDYSIHDAIEAGFNKVVFIIRKDIEDDFREQIGNRIEKIVKVEYVFQELNDLPDGFHVPEARVKPWGTGQAVRAVRSVVKEPFAVINADDYYGKEGFKKIQTYMQEQMKQGQEVFDICMSGFVLKNTLSDNGTVARGVCEVSAENTLDAVCETFEIGYREGKLRGETGAGKAVELSEEQIVSMNMWGFPSDFLNVLEGKFVEFLNSITEEDIKAEFLLPNIVDQMIQNGKAVVSVLESKDKWFGVTYQEDKPIVVEGIRNLIKAGVYKENLYD